MVFKRDQKANHESKGLEELLHHLQPILIILATLLTVISVNAKPQSRQPRQQPVSNVTTLAEKEEWEKLKKHYLENFPLLSGLSWRLIHTYESREEMDRALKLFEKIAVALASNNPATIHKFNGPNGLKRQLVALMDSKDGTVSGFAARMLAILGDVSSAPQIASLLDRQKDAGPDVHPPVTVRGEAALALASLGLKEYAGRIAHLLQSENVYDRSGAAMALATLNATEYAQSIADLLKVDAGPIRNDTPIYALFEMGVAADYEKEIAAVLNDKFADDRVAAAAYALARLGAKHRASEVAKHLHAGYLNRDVVKALALLNAKEHVAEIARILSNERSYNREAAALALGILGAHEYIADIAKLLKDKTKERDGARALVLLEANAYAARVLPIISRQLSGAYFSTEDFNPLVEEQAADLDQRFRVLLKKMKASQPTRAAKSPARRRR